MKSCPTCKSLYPTDFTVCPRDGVALLVEQWRQLYNKVRPQSALDYRPPAPEAIEIVPLLGASQPGSGGAALAVN